jgi:adenylylsulfate kinase-like enzyme
MDVRSGMGMNGHGRTVHLYGYPCAGKTTIGSRLAQEMGRAVILDGDYIRKYLSSDLGFSNKDRIENSRRIGNYAALLNDQGFDTVICTVAPHRKCRKIIRDTVIDYTSVYIDTPLEICKSRDTKGMYKEAIEGTRKGFTGVHEFIDMGVPDIIVRPAPLPAQVQYIMLQLAGN